MNTQTRIVYESRYGSTRQYAGWLGEALGVPVQDRREVSNETLRGCGGLIYGSWICAGRLAGAGWLKKRLSLLEGKPLLLFGVGMLPEYPPASPAKASGLEGADCFCLPGRMDPAALSPAHKLLLSLFRRMLSKQPALSPEEQAISDALRNPSDQVDPAHLEPLLEAARKIFP